MVFDRRKRSSNKVEGSIELRITHERKQVFFATGIKCLPKQWKNGCIVNRTDAFELNDALDIFMKQARDVINESMRQGAFDIHLVTYLMNPKKDSKEKQHKEEAHGPLLVDYMRERAEVRKFGKKADSCKRYDRFINWFESWGGMVTFADVTEANIINMDHALDRKIRSGEMKAKSKWHNYHRFLNAFLIDAKEDGIIAKNPYRRLKIDHGDDGDGLEKCLTKEEFHRIETLNPPTEYMRHVRDLFVFQVYTCMAYVDLESFNKKMIRYVDGRPMYFGNRGKTGKEFSFLLMKPAMNILKMYDMCLPIMSNQKYNQQLKNLAVMANIDKPLSTHWARHTGATLLLNSGVDMEIVSRILGHSSTKMTRDVYAKMLDSTIADAMEKVNF